MPVPSTIGDLSTIAASNYPAGSESPTTLDDYQRAHAAFIAQLRDRTSDEAKFLGVVTGSNTITGTLTPAPTAYVAGQSYRFIVSGDNTGPTTINLNGLGDKAITKNGAEPLAEGDLVAGALVTINYDGAQFQLLYGSNPALGTAATADKQTTVLDDTPGDLMIVGAFGLGASISVTDADGVPIGGSFAVLESPFDNGPVMVGDELSASYTLISNIAEDGYGSQIAIPFGSSSTLMFRRSLTGWVWGDWDEVITQASYFPPECTAWVNFDGTGSMSIRDSHNVSSVTDYAAGRYQINFDYEMNNNNYSVVSSNNGVGNNISHIQAIEAAFFKIETPDRESAIYDCSIVCAQVFGGV